MLKVLFVLRKLNGSEIYKIYNIARIMFRELEGKKNQQTKLQCFQVKSISTHIQDNNYAVRVGIPDILSASMFCSVRIS